MSKLVILHLAFACIFVVSVISAQQLEITSLAAGKPIEREIKTGEAHSYSISLETGQFLDATVDQRGIDVVVRVFSPDNTKIAEIDSPNGTQGPEPVGVEAKASGIYRIEVFPNSSPNNKPAGKYEIRINKLLSANEYAVLLAERERKKQAVIAWLKSNAVDVKTVEAESGFDDLRPLKKTFKDVKVLGIGEETHGTSEFFKFKHRMLEFLVKEMGFRVFAIEASYSACQNINDYVMGKTGDGASALASQRFWTWDTKEVMAMLDWIRRYNAGAPNDRKVRFAGFDIQINETGKARVLEYLKKAAPEMVAEAETLFKIDENEIAYSALEQGAKNKEVQARMQDLTDKYNRLFIYFDLNETRLVARSSPAEYLQMREYLRVILQFLDAYGRPGGARYRDRYMADNFHRLVESEPPGTRFVVWAHNGHIAVNKGAGTSLGSYLRGLYGESYYALGFSFNKGEFRAMTPRADDRSKFELAQIAVGAAAAESIDWYMAQTGKNSFVVDLRGPGKSREFAEWMATPHPMRSIGSTYISTRNFFFPLVPQNEFDGLFFIDTTTAARANMSGKDVVK